VIQALIQILTHQRIFEQGEDASLLVSLEKRAVKYYWPMTALKSIDWEHRVSNQICVVRFQKPRILKESHRPTG